MAAASKDTIYIDVDDEITSIVDKVSSAKHHIVALVLPKRAAVLQSIVNMKLLKRTADSNKKKVVLITSEAGLLPLAGAVGLYVAKNLQSKPGIPAGPSVSDHVETVDADETANSEEAEETPLDPTKSVGALAGIAEKDDDVIEVDNDDIAEAGAAAGAIKGGKKAKKNKKLSVPNFNKLRVRLVLAGLGVVALIFFWILATFVLPKSHVTVHTETSDITTSLAFTASPTAKTLDETKLILPAEKKEIKKDSSQKVPATGQKDIGTKATGTMTVYNCTDNTITVPVGAIFTSNGLSYAVNTAVSVPGSNFTSSGICKKDGHANTTVTAVASGDKYNIDSTEYSSNISSKVTGTGSAMSGGTSQIVKVVSQSDIDSAKQKIVEQGNSGAAEELKAALKTDGYFALSETQSASDPAITTSAKAGDQATEVTVTATTTYSMIGVKENDLKKIIDNDANKHIDSSKQVVLDEGLGSATLQVGEKQGDNTKINLQTTVTAGPELSVDTVRQLVAGKKKGDGAAALEARPGVKSAEIKFSPFWVSKSPKKTSKISVTFEKSSDKSK